MSSIQHFEQFEKAFYSDGYKLGMNVVESKLTKETLFSSIKNMYLAIDEFIDSLSVFAKKQGQKIDCKKGCDWCCCQSVFVLSYEMDYLNTFIKESLDTQTQNGILVRANNMKKIRSRLKSSDILNSNLPCPLLKNGVCLAYDARPMACRIYLSTNVKTCENFYNHPENDKNIPALLDFPMRAGRMMNEGFKSALKTQGMIIKEFRIRDKILQGV